MFTQASYTVSTTSLEKPYKATSNYCCYSFTCVSQLGENILGKPQTCDKNTKDMISDMSHLYASKNYEFWALPENLHKNTLDYGISLRQKGYAHYSR